LELSRQPLCSSQPPWRPASAEAQIFEGDFESSNLSQWDNVATDRYWTTTDPDQVRSGDYSLEGRITGEGWGEINKRFLPGHDEIYVCYSVMFEEGFQNLRGDGNVMHFASVAGNRIDNQWSSHGQAGIVPNGTDFFVTTIDPQHFHSDPTRRPFMLYTY
jgi:hypothetical protein